MRRNGIAAALALVALAAGMGARNDRDVATGGGERVGLTGLPAPAAFDPTQLPQIDEPADGDCQADADCKPRVYTDLVTGVTVTKPTIIQISLPGCPPCAEFMASGREPYDKAGWEITEVKRPVAGVSVYPSYRILNRGQWHWHHGPMTFASMRRALGLVYSEQTSQDYATSTRLVATIPSGSGRSWTQGGRAWSAASLRAHLHAENHRYPPGSLDHLSLDELDRLHTADHEGLTSAVRFRSPVAATRSSSAVMTSGGCPTGGCPQQSYQMTRPLFSGFRRGRGVW